MDLYQYANNCTPTPSLTQQHSTDKKRLGLMLDLGRGRCAAAQILTLIRYIGCPRLRISLIIFFIHQYFHLCSDLSLKFSWYWGLFEYPDLYQNFSPFSRSSFACQWTGGWRTTIVRFSWHRGKTVNLTTAVINRGWAGGDFIPRGRNNWDMLIIPCWYRGPLRESSGNIRGLEPYNEISV